MQKKLFVYFAVFLIFVSGRILSQTYELTGNPINTAGWDIVPSAVANTDFIQLTSDQVNQVGGIKLNEPINLNSCSKWRVEFDFRIDGNGTSYAKGDGIAFWYLANPPSAYNLGGGLGIPSGATGLMVGFDTFNNSASGSLAMSKVHILYGINNSASSNNIELNNTPGSTFHSPDLNSTVPFIGAAYKHVEVTGEIDPAILNNWIIKVRINGTLIVNQSFQQSGGTATMNQGYFGFSAATGAASSRQSIKNVKVYLDKIPILQNMVSQSLCPNITTGNGTVDLNSFNSQFVSNPNDYSFTYYIQGNTVPIANPTNFQFNVNTTIVVVIADNASILCDNSGTIQLNLTQSLAPVISSSSSVICFGGSVVLTSSQATGNVWSTGAVTPSITVTSPGTYTLTTSNGTCTSPVSSITISGEADPNVQITGNMVFCEGSNTILTATAAGTGNTYTWSNGTTGNTLSVSSAGTYTVTVTTSSGCHYDKSVSVTQGTVPVVHNSSLSECTSSSTALFDLTSAQSAISSTPGVIFEYYASQADATAGNGNTISTPSAYPSGNAVVYVRVRSGSCSIIAELQLNLTQSLAPVISSSSSVICFGGSVVLTSSQATGNVWSTGAVTPSITVTSPGTYTLTTSNGTCTSPVSSITISGEADPNVQITGNMVFCEGSNTILTATAAGTGNTYTWSNGTTGNTLSVSSAGTYTVTVTTSSGCHYDKSVSVTQGTVPVVHNSSLSECTSSSTALFDLTSAQSAISSTPGVIFEYYASQADATAGNGNTISTPSAYPSGNAVVYVRVRSGSCSIIAELQLNLTQSLAPVISSSSSVICFGGSVVLTSSQATGNVWSTGAVTPSITVTSPGTYTLTTSNGTCTSPVSSITISGEADPNVQITGNMVFCEGSNTILTATAAGTGNTYTWSNGTTGNTLSVSSAGTYTVTVTTSSGCHYDKSVSVTQGTVPVVHNSSLSECTSSSTALFDLTSAQSAISSTPGVIFEYYASQADATAGNGNTISTPSAYPSGNAVVYVRVRSGSCSIIAELQLNLTQSLAPVISSSSSVICFGGSVVLTSSQATGNVWSTGAVTPSITVTSPGTYTLTTSNGTCTSPVSSITISGEADPNVQITGNMVFCEGSNTILTATAAGTGNTYTWSNGTTGNTLSVSSAGTYTVTVTTSSGCHYDKSVSVTQGTVPVVHNSSLSECTSSSTALFDLTSAQSAISSTPGVIFEYYASQADATAGNGNTISTPSAYPSGNAVVYVRVRSGSCSIIAELQLNLTQSLAPVISSSSSVICFGGSVVLTSSQATGNVWSTGAVTPSITVTSPGTYTLTTSNGTCTSPVSSITISGEADPNVQITGNMVFCEGSNTILTATAAGTGNTYTWSNGTTGNTLSVSSAGTYTVTVTTSSGCHYDKSVSVTQGTVPVVHNSSLSECTSSSTALFDLTSAQSAISSTPGVIFEYYASQADATAGNGNTISTPSAYPSGNAVVYVRVRSGSCSIIAELQLNLTQSLAPVISSSSSVICFGGSVVLTSSQATGNVWSTGAVTPSITVTSPGTYTLTTSNGTCTSPVSSITISGEADPNVQITGNMVFCEGSNTILTATAAGTGNTYTWSNGTTGNTLSVSSAGTYTVTVTTSSGCHYDKSVSVTQGTVPVVHNSSLSECTSSSTALFDLTSAQSAISSTPGVIFEYYASQADATAGNGNTISTPSAYPSGNAVVYVRVRSGSCSIIAELQLNLTQSLAPVISSSSSVICFGGSVVLTSSQATGNVWSTGAVTPSITVTSPGTYTLTTSNGTCTSPVSSITISGEADPNVQITGNMVFCEGSNTILTATAAGTGNTYTWSNGTTGNTLSVSSAGTYTVTVTTSSGCHYQKSVMVNASMAMIVNIDIPAEITCVNSQITLNATSSVYQQGASFFWTATNGGNILSGANTLTPTVNNSGTYSLTITSALGCIKQAGVNVLANTTPPTISITAPRFTICAGESIALTASGAISYNWAGLTGNGNSQTVTPHTTTTYTVMGIGDNGCSTQTPGTITINVVPEITSSLKDIEICQGDRGILDAGSGPNYTYIWSTGEKTQTISITTVGTYNVTISNGGCLKTFTATVSYSVIPEITEIIYKNNTLIISAENKNNGNVSLEYSIDGGIAWQSSNIFTNVLKNTQYTIRVRNRGTFCEAQAEYYTFFMSNVITPNGDGIHDVIDFSEISKYGSFDGNIFDKYGKKVFGLSSKTPIWDGKYIGAPLPSDTYWYKLFWKDKISEKPVELSGWILLKNRD